MPYKFNWHDDAHSIVRIDIHGTVSWEKFHEVMQMVADELDKTSHRIDIILHDKSAGMPPGNPLPHIKSVATKLIDHENMGVLVMANQRGTSKVVQTMVNIAYRAYGIDTRIVGDFVATLEDAEASIAKLRAEAEKTS